MHVHDPQANPPGSVTSPVTGCRYDAGNSAQGKGMKASKYNAAASGHGKWFVAIGRNPESYRYGPHDSRAEAEEEAAALLEESKREVATIGIGEEVILHPPDAAEVIETICDSLYDQCGEASVEYLGRRQVSEDQQAELTAAIEKAVAEWMDRHHLWPDFCTVEEVGTVTREKREVHE